MFFDWSVEVNPHKPTEYALNLMQVVSTHTHTRLNLQLLLCFLFITVQYFQITTLNPKPYTLIVFLVYYSTVLYFQITGSHYTTGSEAVLSRNVHGI